jgi:ABC-type branched-subunit amino acid transport system permease subunit
LSTFQGLPAHILLVHFIVVLAPLTAVLAIVCALWPAARRQFTWLVLILAAVTTALTPLTTEAGEWLEHRTKRTDLLHAHTELGDTMLYFSVSLLVAAALLAFRPCTGIPPTGAGTGDYLGHRRGRRPGERRHGRSGLPDRRLRSEISLG